MVHLVNKIRIRRQEFFYQFVFSEETFCDKEKRSFILRKKFQNAIVELKSNCSRLNFEHVLFAAAYILKNFAGHVLFAAVSYLDSVVMFDVVS